MKKYFEPKISTLLDLTDLTNSKLIHYINIFGRLGKV